MNTSRSRTISGSLAMRAATPWNLSASSSNTREPWPTQCRVSSSLTGGNDAAASAAFSAALMSGAVSSSVPSRSKRYAGYPRVSTSGRKRTSHRGDRRAVVRRAEDRGAGDECISACMRGRGNVVDFDAAIDFESDRAAGLLDRAAGRFHLLEARRNERLTAKARVHGHDEHEIDEVDHLVEHGKRGPRIEHESGLCTALSNQRQRT